MADDDELEPEVNETETDNADEDALAEVLADLGDDEVADLADGLDDEASRATSRFDRLVAELVAKGHTEESARRVAAFAGRRKYGREGFAALAAAGRAKAKAKKAAKGAMRSTAVPGGPMYYQHFRPLEGIEISRAHSDGRTVVAYASYFDNPYPVSDQYGDYDEVVERSAFNKWLRDGNISRAVCLYNHGFTIHGTPSDAYSVPLGVPLEIKPDGKGLVTITRYNEGADADRVLAAINNNAIRGQSFRGKVVRSSPSGRRFGLGRDGKRVTVVRHELTIADYGPTPVPVNPSAEILMVRSVLSVLPEDERANLIREYVPTTPQEPEGQSAESPIEEIGTAEPLDVARSESEHSGRQLSQADIARKARVALLLRGGN